MASRFADPIVAAGVSDLSRMFALKQASPIDALDTYLSRIYRLNPTLNAFLTLDLERAKRDAAASQARWASGAPLSPLDGVPIGVKANFAVAGLPWHAGIEAYRDRVAEQDAECVAALRRAGAVILGLLNMHEAALGATSDNLAFGRCHNPYRYDFTPGGSSGGSAAAVSAGLCAAALGSDTLGSVRIPAAYCGGFGHKPSIGRISTAGVTPLSWTLDTIGVHARSIEDARALLAGLNAAPIGEHAADQPIRCAIIDFKGRVDLDTNVAQAFDQTVETAREAGFSLEHVALEHWDVAAIRRLSLFIVEVEAAVEHEVRLRENPDGFSANLRAMLDWGARQSAPKLAKAYWDIKLAADETLRTLSGFDAILTPTTTTPAFSFDAKPPADQAEFTVIANLTGLPATAFALGLSDEGLPLSAQVISASETTALTLAERLAVPTPAPRDYRD
jgi:aspartyl-tRNA(Asn)/glutamyl-tRNA(Gln) amidotransferase subunit A